MQQKLSDLFSNKLAAYAASACCFLMRHQEATAQVVYTDIDPDIVLDEAFENAGIDIDNNGTLDFAFVNYSFSYYNESWLSYRIRQDILVGPNISQNAIVGIPFYFSTGYGAFTWYYPLALIANNFISSAMEWQTIGQQILAIRTYYESGNIYNKGGYWYPETTDHYLGIRFIDDEEQNHYGWIRCDVINEGRTLIIKDYAYEIEPEYPILAGDTSHFVGVNESTNLFNASIYNYGSNLFVLIPDFEEVEMVIYNSNGAELINRKIVNTFSIFNMLTYEKGLYIVMLKTKNANFSQTILLH